MPRHARLVRVLAFALALLVFPAALVLKDLKPWFSKAGIGTARGRYRRR